MSSTGSPPDPIEPPVDAENDETQPPSRGVLSWLALLGSLVIVAVALFLGFQIVAVLYGILFPPPPPTLPGMTELTHQTIEHGVDEWRYVTDSLPSEFAAFYREQGGVCNDPAQSSDALGALLEDNQRGILCSGERAFSIFRMHWEAFISPSEPQNIVRLSRRILWTG